VTCDRPEPSVETLGYYQNVPTGQNIIGKAVYYSYYLTRPDLSRLAPPSVANRRSAGALGAFWLHCVITTIIIVFKCGVESGGCRNYRRRTGFCGCSFHYNTFIINVISIKITISRGLKSSAGYNSRRYEFGSAFCKSDLVLRYYESCFDWAEQSGQVRGGDCFKRRERKGTMLSRGIGGMLKNQVLKDQDQGALR
jgi:hypothetical protein